MRGELIPLVQKKTWAAGITTAAIVTTTLAAPGIAQAQPGTTALQAVGSPLSSSSSWVPFDNDALFSEFVSRLFYGGPFVSFYSTSGHDQLSGLQLEAYDALHDVITQIACGQRTSTKGIELPKKTWTYEELGIEYNGEQTNFDPAVSRYQDAISRALDALLDDCPYELYWYNKVAEHEGGTRTSFSIGLTDTEVTLTPSVSMSVALDYRDDPSEPYAVDGTDAQRAISARVKAQEIVNSNEGKSDLEKLVAYRDAICELVDYDDAAADPGTSTSYGDPWQIVSVFDGYGSTKVVCEGYAKAFQYLCDLSSFESNIRCTTVHGVMDGGTGAGNHMWNVIRMGDGRTYLVDVTNSDKGTIGQDGGLFIENYDKVLDRFEEKELDLVFVTDNMLLRRKCARLFRPFCRMEAFAVVDEEHPLVGRERLAFSELEEQVLIRMSNSFVPFNTGNPLTRLIEVHGLQGRDIHCDDDRLMMSLAKAGYGVAILPGYCIPTYAEQIGLRCIPIEESQKLVYGAAVHRGREKKSLEAILRLAAAELRAGPRTMRKPVEAEDMDQ